MTHLADSAKVSFHAVSRYVQILFGVVVDSDAVGRDLAEMCAAAAGTSVEEIRRRIYTPAVAAALAMNAVEFTVGRITFSALDGVIVSVSRRSLPKTHSERRLRILSEQENRRSVDKYQRRHALRRSSHQALTAGVPDAAEQ